MIPEEIYKRYDLGSIDYYIERTRNEHDGKLMFYQIFLKQTDHIPNKIFERMIEDLASATLTNFVSVFIKFIYDVRIEYKDILQYRKVAREEINKLETATE